MYRKYKEQKDKEYETIIRRQVNESKLVAEREGISIPKTLEDYVAPSKADAIGRNGSHASSFHDDDLDIDVRMKTTDPEKDFLLKTYLSLSFPLFSFQDDDDPIADIAGDDDDGSYHDSE